MDLKKFELDTKMFGKDTQKLIDFLNKTDGRDKFCKTIQFAAKFLKGYYAKQENKSKVEKLSSLIDGMSNARGLLRLLKYIDEINKILSHISDNKMDKQEKILNIAIKTFLSLFEICDNIGVLCKIKVLQQDEKGFLRTGQQFQFGALIFILIQCVKQIIFLFRKKEEIKAELQKNSANEDLQSKLTKINQKIQEISIKLIITICDFIPVGSSSNIWNSLIGCVPSEQFQGLCGFISAFLACYQLF